VRDLVAKVRGWWGGGAVSGPVRPFQVTCGCGQVVQGVRRSRHQVVSCRACGTRLFVLPRSPLPPPAPPSAKSQPIIHPASRSSPPPPRPLRVRLRLPSGPWRLPLLAALLTLAVVVMVYVTLFLLFVQRPQSAETSGAEAIQDHVRAGKLALADQDFPAALKAFQKARAGYDQQPPLARAASEGRRLQQLVRQAEVLANRLPEPLERMLRRWDKLEGEELENVTVPYRNKFAVFDLEVMKDGANQVRYRRLLGPEVPQLGLDGLVLIDRLASRNHFRRLLFAAQLAGVTRDPDDRLTVGLVPDSGVLITEQEVARACFPVVDDEMRDVLEWQTERVLEWP
jgi:hypothetical protein